MKMKIWNTKYCLTKGMIEHNISAINITDNLVKVGPYEYLHGEEKDWHRTKEAAQFRANEVRIKKLQSLDKQIKKIGALIF
jgi:hypothetical protein